MHLEAIAVIIIVVVVVYVVVVIIVVLVVIPERSQVRLPAVASVIDLFRITKIKLKRKKNGTKKS